MGTAETLNFVLFFCWVLRDYIWRDHISRVRHERAQMEPQRERRMMDIFDPNNDTYLPHIGQRSERHTKRKPRPADKRAFSWGSRLPELFCRHQILHRGVTVVSSIRSVNEFQFGF
jgi:hypothetical protein